MVKGSFSPGPHFRRSGRQGRRGFLNELSGYMPGRRLSVRDSSKLHARTAIPHRPRTHTQRGDYLVKVRAVSLPVFEVELNQAHGPLCSAWYSPPAQARSRASVLKLRSAAPLSIVRLLLSARREIFDSRHAEVRFFTRKQLRVVHLLKLVPGTRLCLVERGFHPVVRRTYQQI
jgi:hypothetical protein